MSKERITTTIEELLRRLGYEDFSVDVLEEPDIDLSIYSISLDQPGLLIGRNGEVLKALNHIVRQTYDATSEKPHNFLVDVNNYSKKRIDTLKTRARIVADRAKSFKKDIEMQPMTAYDRLLTHSFLSTIDNIETESQGEGLQRHIVVKFVPSSQ